METNKGKDKEKYSKINISDDEDDFESKSFISRTLEIPRIILEKPLKKLFKKVNEHNLMVSLFDYMNQWLKVKLFEGECK